jgi:CRP/FNR family cyclic AMP-dependent transcriptional regulator
MVDVSDNLPSLLSRFQLFAHFGDRQLEELAAMSTFQEFESDVVTLHEGDPATQLILVLKGAFRVQHTTHFGPLTLGHVLPGDLLGDMGYIDGKSHAADAVTETDVQALVFETEELTAKAQVDSAFAAAMLWVLWRSLSGKLRKSNGQLAGFFKGDATSPPLEIPLAKTLYEDDFHIDMATKRSIFQEQLLSSLEINLLSTLSRERRYDAGEVIFHEGEQGDEMFVIVSGTVLISKFIPGAGEEALTFLSRGDYFGEMALIDNEPRSAGARAHHNDVTVLAIPRELVDDLLSIDRISSLRLLRLLCSMVALRLRQSNGKLLGWYLLSAGRSS